MTFPNSELEHVGSSWKGKQVLKSSNKAIEDIFTISGHPFCHWLFYSNFLLFLLICKVSLSAYNWTSTTVSLLAGWGNWVILPSISIAICYFFLIKTSIFFTFRKIIITIWIIYRFMVYLEGDNPDHLAMFVPHQAQSEVRIIDSLKSLCLTFLQIGVYDVLDVVQCLYKFLLRVAVILGAGLMTIGTASRYWECFKV